MKKILLVLCLTTLTSCATPLTPEAQQSGISFVHLNDTYRIGAVDSGKIGGFGRVVTVVRELQAEGRDVRILHGGDFLYPSLESQLWDGLQMIDAFNFMNAIAPLYAVAGNHEFDRRGPKQLIDAVKASDFVWLGDNYRFDTGDAAADAALQSTYRFEVGGRTIGVVALTLHPDDGGNARTYVPTDRDYIGTARRVMRELEAAGVDAIIGITHLHMWLDEDVARLKREHPRLVLVVGGHEHDIQHSRGSELAATVVKGAANARAIWRIDLEFGADGMPYAEEELIAVDESIATDPGYGMLEQKWRGRLLQKFPFLDAKVGTAAVELDSREEVVRAVESNWGNFIVDQMRLAFGEPHADFAFLNGGTLRIDDTISGDILFEDIGRTFGFSSYLRYMTMNGAEFKEVIEAGYRGGPEAQGYFPQVSGFRVCVDRSRPEYKRIASLQVPVADGWQEIDDQREYSVVVPDYLYGGGDGYNMPEGREGSRPGSELKYLVLDAILRAQALGKSVGQPVDPQNPRIVVLREAKQPCWP